jgi:hypothetical protein
MRSEALFINGVYEGVLEEILQVQQFLPEHIMYLQPYAGSAIRHLHDKPPSPEEAVLLYLSTTTALGEIRYCAEIVGIDDKRTLSRDKRNVLNRVIWTLQPNETGLYGDANGQECVNLLYIRRLQQLKPPVPVTQLVKTGDDTPIAGARTTAGGWSYVRPLNGHPGAA